MKHAAEGLECGRTIESVTVAGGAVAFTDVARLADNRQRREGPRVAGGPLRRGHRNGCNQWRLGLMERRFSGANVTESRWRRQERSYSVTVVYFRKLEEELPRPAPLLPLR